MEVAIATALLSLGISLVGTAVFQVLSAQGSWQDDVVATKDLRHVGSWFAGDLLNTDTTDLINDAPPVDNIVLTTFNGDQITYNVSGNSLTRVFDDGTTLYQNILSSKAVSVAFSRSTDLVTMVLVVKAERGGTETITLNTNLR